MIRRIGNTFIAHKIRFNLCSLITHRNTVSTLFFDVINFGKRTRNTTKRSHYHHVPHPVLVYTQFNISFPIPSSNLPHIHVPHIFFLLGSFFKRSKFHGRKFAI